MSDLDITITSNLRTGSLRGRKKIRRAKFESGSEANGGRSISTRAKRVGHTALGSSCSQTQPRACSQAKLQDAGERSDRGIAVEDAHFQRNARGFLKKRHLCGCEDHRALNVGEKISGRRDFLDADRLRVETVETRVCCLDSVL